MSEYTTVYLRHKEMPLLKNKEYPSHEEYQSLSKEDLMEVICEIDEYNKQVAKPLRCKLFYLSTTPSRELTVLPYSPSPSVLTNVLLEEVLCFYKEEIKHCKKAIAKNKEDIAKLEVRITKTTLRKKNLNTINYCIINFLSWRVLLAMNRIQRIMN